ncbi:MAG: PAS domain S-box protein [Ginsengibacter sp.]
MQIQNYEDTARLAAIIDSSQDAIISKNFDGTINSWNAGAEAIFGFSAVEAINQNISIIIPPEYLDKEKEIIKKVKNGEQIKRYETVRRKKNGEQILIDLSISPIRDANNNIIGASKIARDITELRKADETQAMLAAIVNSSDDAIISKNFDGIITSWNVSAVKLFGYTAQEAVGKHISLIIPKDHLDEEAEIIRNIRAGNKIDHIETVRVRKDGTEINISLTVSPIKNKYGKVVGASKIARDITERSRIELQKKLYTKRLQELNTNKDEFMAMASHELKTPLTVIKASLQVLETRMQLDPNVALLQTSVRQANKLSKLIEDLLDASKIQAGKMVLNKSHFQLDQLINDVITYLRPLSQQHNIVCKEPPEPITLLADKNRIEQVLVNILSNAIKYTPNAGDIIIHTVQEQDLVTVSILDSGIGIPQEDLKDIFSRFYRVGGLPTTFAGSGIGLYIAAEIIQRHEGKIWAESTLGTGSTFHFQIKSH